MLIHLSMQGDEQQELARVADAVQSRLPSREKRSLVFSGAELTAFVQKEFRKSDLAGLLVRTGRVVPVAAGNSDGQMREKTLYGFAEETEAVRRLYGRLVDVREGVRVANHTNRAKVRFSLCFSGADGVDWLVQNGGQETRRLARRMLQTMMDMGLIGHMVGKNKYEDSATAFYRCTSAPPLHLPLFKEGHVSVSFSDSRLQYFSMYAQLDAHGVRFFRAREHADNSYPIIYVPATSINTDSFDSSASIQGQSGGVSAAAPAHVTAESSEEPKPRKRSPRGAPDASKSLSRSSKVAPPLSRGSKVAAQKSQPNSITKTFLDAGGSDALGYQGVVWEFGPAMALWERMLTKQAEKNSSFIDGQGAITGHEFAIRLKGPVRGGFGEDDGDAAVQHIFFACGVARDKIEWLLALDTIILRANPVDKPELLMYTAAVGLPLKPAKTIRDYGSQGVPCQSRLLDLTQKNEYLRALVPEDNFCHKGWVFRSNLLIRQSPQRVVYSWNGFFGAYVSGDDSVASVGYFHFDGSTLRCCASKDDFASEKCEMSVQVHWSHVVPKLLDVLEERLGKQDIVSL